MSNANIAVLWNLRSICFPTNESVFLTPPPKLKSNCLLSFSVPFVRKVSLLPPKRLPMLQHVAMLAATEKSDKLQACRHLVQSLFTGTGKCNRANVTLQFKGFCLEQLLSFSFCGLVACYWKTTR